jgi:hypothetical protein
VRRLASPTPIHSSTKTNQYPTRGGALLPVLRHTETVSTNDIDDQDNLPAERFVHLKRRPVLLRTITAVILPPLPCSGTMPYAGRRGWANEFGQLLLLL